jgi:hypothetical protein
MSDKSARLSTQPIKSILSTDSLWRNVTAAQEPRPTSFGYEASPPFEDDYEAIRAARFRSTSGKKAVSRPAADDPCTIQRSVATSMR